MLTERERARERESKRCRRNRHDRPKKRLKKWQGCKQEVVSEASQEEGGSQKNTLCPAPPSLFVYMHKRTSSYLVIILSIT
jgi:hypothetical protein